jgi:transposase
VVGGDRAAAAEGERRTRHPGCKRYTDRLVFQGILFMLHTGIAWNTCRWNSVHATAVTWARDGER